MLVIDDKHFYDGIKGLIDRTPSCTTNFCDEMCASYENLSMKID